MAHILTACSNDTAQFGAREPTGSWVALWRTLGMAAYLPGCLHFYYLYRCVNWTDNDLGTGNDARSKYEMRKSSQYGNGHFLLQSSAPLLELTALLPSVHHKNHICLFRQATNQQSERDSARVELVYQCHRTCNAWFAFTAGRNTVHDTTVPAAAVICNLLAQQHAHHACFWRIGPSNRPCTVQPVHG
jgi:hypothetical protein